MTRENKLALIVGFSIILVVGVLVSDHFSQARQARLTQVEGEARVSTPGSLVDPLTRDEGPPREAYFQRDAGIDRPVASGRGLLGDAISSAEQDRPTLALDDPDPLRGTADPIDGGAPQGVPVVIHQGVPREDEAVAINDDPLFELMRKAREEGVPLALESSPSTVRPRLEPRTTAPAPSYAEYVVEQNDSLYAIAKRFLGSGERWRELRDLNKDRLSNGEVLRIGMRLRVPASRDVTSGPTTRPATDRPAAATPSRQSPKASREYEVKAGDVLGVIAQRELGSSKRIGEILELNKDRLSDADEIYVGMKLRLPAR